MIFVFYKKNNDDGYLEIVENLTNYCCVGPKLYVLPKVYKSILSSIPIISLLISPITKLTVFITNILTAAYNQEKFFVTNSFQHAEIIIEFQFKLQNF